MDIQAVELRPNHWTFKVDGQFVDGEFDPMWGLRTYASRQIALEAAVHYRKRIEDSRDE